jgi:hypothetical protein
VNSRLNLNDRLSIATCKQIMFKFKFQMENLSYFDRDYKHNNSFISIWLLSFKLNPKMGPIYFRTHVQFIPRYMCIILIVAHRWTIIRVSICQNKWQEKWKIQFNYQIYKKINNAFIPYEPRLFLVNVFRYFGLKLKK